ncbi:hypothetical protein MMC07_003582 [Pseudocyphellaria aurata]|nr:hypothetical protein [Pseudocyphellaria aurata]
MATNNSNEPAWKNNICLYNEPKDGLDLNLETVAYCSTHGGELTGGDFSLPNTPSSPTFPPDLPARLLDFSCFPELDLSKESEDKITPFDSCDSFLIDVGQDVDWSTLETDQLNESVALNLDKSSAPDLAAHLNLEAFRSAPFNSRGFLSTNRQAGQETDEGVKFNSIQVQETTSTSTVYSTQLTLDPTPKTPGLCSRSNIDLLTDDQCWHAVSTRSHAADQLFVYGVQSTKIYCRPSCPSRRPSRRRAQFFLFPGAIDAAEKALFRACKRCKPKTIGTANAGVLGVGLALEKIAAESERQSGTHSERQEESKLEALARAAGLSTFHFHRLFKAITRMTPGEYANACHSLALQDALGKAHGNDSRSEGDIMASREVISRWSARTARKALGGISPAAYAQGAKAEAVEYTLTDTAFGRICVAWSKNKSACCCEGSCGAGVRIHALLFGEAAEKRVRESFPFAKPSHEHSQWLRECVQTLEDEGKDRETELPAGAVPLLRRAKLWLTLVHEPTMGGKWGGEEDGRCNQIS